VAFRGGREEDRERRIVHAGDFQNIRESGWGASTTSLGGLAFGPPARRSSRAATFGVAGGRSRARGLAVSITRQVMVGRIEILLSPPRPLESFAARRYAGSRARGQAESIPYPRASAPSSRIIHGPRRSGCPTVRYGRRRHGVPAAIGYRRRSVSFTVAVSSTSMDHLSQVQRLESRGRKSVIGRPMVAGESDSGFFPAAGGKPPYLQIAAQYHKSRCERWKSGCADRRFIRLSSVMRFCSSSLTVVNSSFVDCSSSLRGLPAPR